MDKVPFSSQLERWLKNKRPKTIEDLTRVFGEKSFAIVIVVLMFVPALPLPTGGITHIFELITMLLGIELIAGRRTIWLPKKWKRLQLGEFMQQKTIPLIIRQIRWFEKRSKPRLGNFLNHHTTLRLIGFLFLIFALGAFMSPPFAGLDTLPSLGAVIIGLSLILEDFALFIFGCLVGAIGVGLVIGTTGLTIKFIEKLLHH